MTHSHVDPGDELWLASTWPLVAGHLPAAPATVLEIGCGPLGGFVPPMRAAGYQAIGIDPEAPAGAEFAQTQFEDYELIQPVDAIVASTSMHHVADVDDVLDRVRSALTPGGVFVVVEWAHERFDEATARWCFDRLGPADGDEGGWLHRVRDEWRESGQSWDDYFQARVREEGMHPGRDIVRGLQARFATRALVEGPYFFPNLDGVTSADEQAAIDAGLIQAPGIRFAGQA